MQLKNVMRFVLFCSLCIGASASFAFLDCPKTEEVKEALNTHQNNVGQFMVSTSIPDMISDLSFYDTVVDHFTGKGPTCNYHTNDGQLVSVMFELPTVLSSHGWFQEGGISRFRCLGPDVHACQFIVNEDPESDS